jgi:iron complex outermembrane receptor protein
MLHERSKRAVGCSLFTGVLKGSELTPPEAVRLQKGGRTMKKTHILLTSTAFAAGAILCAPSAIAQTTTTTADQTGTSSPGSRPTTEAPASQAVTSEDILKDIVVTGRDRRRAGGLMIVQRQPETTNSITAEAIAQKMSLAGTYQLVASLPGVNTGQSDPYQMSQRYGLFLRGLPMNDIGWVLDGAPAIDQAYNLAYSETWADNENIAGLTILPGSTRIVDPVQTAVAGEFNMTIRDPSEEPGAQGSYSYGTFRANRIFAGIDTGEIGNSGLKAFGSVSYTKAGSFALPSDANGTRLHVDFKVAKDWGDVAKSTIFMSYNNWDVLRSQPVTLAQFRTSQQTGDFTTPNYRPTFDPFSNSNNWYKHAIYTRDDVRVISNNNISVSDRLKLTIIPYYHWIRSNSPGGSSLNPASIFSGNQQQTISTSGRFLLPNGNIPVKSNILQNESSYGVNSYLKYNLSESNELTAGWWYDHWRMLQTNNFSPIASNGDAPNWAEGPLLSTSGQMVTGAYFRFHSNINVFSLQDRQSLLDGKLAIEAGFKYFINDLSGTNMVPGPQSAMHQKISKFLPRATISYDISDNAQVYGDVITEIRVPVPITNYPNTYNAATGVLSQIGISSAKPERSLGEELGFRYHDKLLTIDVAVFNKKLTDHSVVSQAFLNGAGINTSINAGGLRMRGITGEIGLSPIHGFSPYVNAQYLSTKTLDNLQVLNDFLPTKGKEGVNSPKFVATIGINYNNGPFFGNVLFKYTGSQYSTFMNDAKLQSYHTIDLGAGYRIPAGYIGKEATIRVSVSNLSNKPYLGTFASVQPNAVNTVGVNGTTIVGRAPTYWLASPRAIMGTFSTKF